jgi:hypothetical protein
MSSGKMSSNEPEEGLSCQVSSRIDVEEEGWEKVTKDISSDGSTGTIIVVVM